MTQLHRIPSDLIEAYHLLSAARRCYVLQSLGNHQQEPLSVRDLAQCMTALEERIPQAAASGDPYRSVYNALTQTHLPKLAKADVVEYDSKRKIVSSGNRIQSIKRLYVTTHGVYRLQQYDDQYGYYRSHLER